MQAGLLLSRCSNWLSSLHLLESLYAADLLFFNLQAATFSIGHAYYPPGQDSQGNYADSPSRVSYTLVSPFTPATITATDDGELYLQTLQRLQQYVVLSAYGGALPPSNNDYCQPG